MKRLLQALFTVLFAVSAQYVAAQKPEDAIKYRRGVMAVIGWNFGSMGAMAKGDKPYDAAAFARNAEIVAFMSKLPLEGFTPGSEKGDTKAKPEIWLEMDDFKAKLEKMQAEVAKLADVAKGGDLNASKAQLGEAGKACKACHDKYRSK
ncbi:MAG TPA: cytochrome c [Burkholderiales bacterium]|nr:cytochrome c [Burkholderiales bacterium]